MKSIKVFIENLQKNKIFVSISVSLIFTLVIIALLNFEPHENVILSTAWLKNTMLGVLLFMCSFVLMQIEFIIDSYKRELKERDHYIDHLKELIVQQVEKDADKKNR